MSHPIRIILLCLAILAGVFVAWGITQATTGVLAAQEVQAPLPTPTPLPNQPALALPDISSSESPNPSCVLPQPGTGDCYITWLYLYANADPNYMITMTLTIDEKVSANFNGFFQTYMFVPTEILSFRVACGGPGASGNPDFGLAHTYTIRARDSSGSKISNNGTLFCPADTLHTRLPMVWK